MQILMAVHHLPPTYKGGAEWRALRTASALQARGHQVQLVSVERIDDGPPGGVRWEDGVFEGIPVRRLSFDQRLVPDRLRWEYDNPWIGSHFRDLFTHNPPDLFHMIGGYLITASTLAAAQELGIPNLVTLTDFWFLCPRIQMLRSNGQLSTLPLNPVTCARCLGEEQRRFSIPGRLAPGLMDVFWRFQSGRITQLGERQAFLLNTLNQVNVIISPSEFLGEMFIEAGIDPQRVAFSRQGRDFPHLDMSRLEKIPSGHLRVGYMGQIADIKGVHLLFEALEHLPGRKLEVRAYGDPGKFPEYTARLQKLAAADPRLELAGVFDSEQISQVLQSVDVIVVPSVWYENSPNVILEAFAHRTPVIATNLGGMAELVEHERNGLLFTLGDPADLARQLERLLDEPGLLSRLQAGICPVRSVKDEIDELEQIYTHLGQDHLQEAKPL